MKEAPSLTTTQSMSVYTSSADYWKAQAEANAKDAERYRWLRRNPAWLGWTRDHQPEHVDAAVDQDMAVGRIGAALRSIDTLG